MDQNMTIQETLDSMVRQLNDTWPGVGVTEDDILDADLDDDLELEFELWMADYRVEMDLPTPPHLLPTPPPIPAQAPTLHTPPPTPAPTTPLQSPPSPLHQAPTQEDEHPICPICLEPLHPDDPELFTTICHHTFHEPCLVEWLLVHEPLNCPYCRSIITGD